MTTTIYRVRFEDSDGRSSTRMGLNYFNAVAKRWPVYDLQGAFAIHDRIEWPRMSKPRKQFRWRHPDGRLSRDGEISGKDRAYGLELVDGQRYGLLVEGEQCADAARRVLPSSWLVAATVCGASSTPENGVLDRLGRVRRWFVWPDADANGKGQEHMGRIAEYLGERCEVRVVTWADAPNGGDVADFLTDHGHAQLMALLHRAERV